MDGTAKQKFFAGPGQAVRLCTHRPVNWYCCIIDINDHKLPHPKLLHTCCNFESVGTQSVVPIELSIHLHIRQSQSTEDVRLSWHKGYILAGMELLGSYRMCPAAT
jgi:hypothetical protein